jgi:hypothetical protein
MSFHSQLLCHDSFPTKQEIHTNNAITYLNMLRDIMRH